MAHESNVGKWDLWGPLRERYESRAKAGGPYRLLALDGGGIPLRRSVPSPTIPSRI